MATTAEPKRPRAYDSGIPWCANPFVEWLLTKGWNIIDPAELVERLAKRLVAAGFPLWRLVCLIRTLHPQVIGTRYMWRRDPGVTNLIYKEYSPPHDVLQTSQYVDSPIAAILFYSRFLEHDFRAGCRDGIQVAHEGSLISHEVR